MIPIANKGNFYDVKEMDVAQPIWLSGCPKKCQFIAKNAPFLNFQKSGSNIQKGLEDNSETVDRYGYL